MKRLESRLSHLRKDPTLDDAYLPDLADRSLWVLRDDELGGFWGTKFRKYASVTKFCHENKISHIIATGGVNSNNLAAAAVLCAEAGIVLTAFAVQDHDDAGPRSGNRMLIRLALPPENLVIVPRNEKEFIAERMRCFAAELTAKGESSLILEEGGGCGAAVAGCLTLADDILRPRPEWPDRAPPAHIFIDSGTALSAGCLAAGLLLRGANRTTKLHIVQMAGFEEQVQQAFQSWITPETKVTWDDVAHFVRVYRPLKPRSYGATNAQLFEFIRHMARRHGILVDPVYSAKLFMRAFDLISGQNCKGRILLVHTGGISGMMGYDLTV
jgi:1-aminocyclopropane-1-carboxylate deaminase